MIFIYYRSNEDVFHDRSLGIKDEEESLNFKGTERRKERYGANQTTTD